MEKIIRLKNRSFVTKSSATRLLGFSNRNSIDDLVRRRKMQEFKIQGIGKVINFPRRNKISSPIPPTGSEAIELCPCSR
jgi:hypothetical protein